jgi:DNA-binding MarR family transcriptional regulator
MANYPLGRLLWNQTQVVLSLVDSIYRAVIRPFGLAVIEWHVVNELYAQDGQRPSDLAQQVGRASTSFTAILDGLEQKAWIDRRRDVHDRRVVRIHLTEQAYKQQAEIEASILTIDTQLLLKLTEVDLEYIQALQKKLVTLVAA